MKGVYKITNPSGSIYIGQSIDVARRFYNHKNTKYKSNCYLLDRSFKKYGVENHLFEILHELPLDASSEVLNNYETFCIQQYKEAGIRLLNVKPTSNNHSEETRRKISESHKGKKKTEQHVKNWRKSMIGKPPPMKGKNHSEATKKKLSEKSKTQINKKGPPKGHIPWNKGLKTGISWNKGISPSDETKAKISASLKGSKLSQETIAKRTATLKKNGVKRKWSEEAKQRQSEKVKQFYANKKLNKPNE